jgi:hypothetical protein
MPSQEIRANQITQLPIAYGRNDDLDVFVLNCLTVPFQASVG